MFENVEILNFGSEIFTDGLVLFLIRSVFAAIVSWAVVRIMGRAFALTSKRQGKTQETALRYVYRTLRTMIAILTAFIILSGIRPLQALGSTILGATSVIAVITGLAAQETFGNYISGFFLALYQPFHIGDIITLPEKNISGTVVEMTFRHTVIRTFSGTSMLIPNGTLNTAIIEDKSSGNYTSWIEVQVAYDTDIEMAKGIIENICEETDGLIDLRSEKELEEDAPIVTIRLVSFDESGVTLRFGVTARDLGINARICSDIREQILVRFRDNHIEIPYPVQTVLLQKDEIEKVS